MPLVVEAPRAILDSPRALLLEEFCAWLENQPLGQRLPGPEVVVTLLPQAFLPPRYTGRRRGLAVGCFAVSISGRLNPRWEVALAWGPRFSDDADAASWATTLPHELLHLVEFAAAHGQPPATAGYAAALAQAPDEDAIEDAARAITDAFLAASPGTLDALATEFIPIPAV